MLRPITVEFKAWVDNLTDDPNYISSLGSPEQRAAFWLHHFAQLVSKEANPDWHMHDKECAEACVGAVFNIFCEKFKLE